jgi:hypothetical protein
VQPIYDTVLQAISRHVVLGPPSAQNWDETYFAEEAQRICAELTSGWSKTEISEAIRRSIEAWLGDPTALEVEDGIQASAADIWAALQPPQ